MKLYNFAAITIFVTFIGHITADLDSIELVNKVLTTQTADGEILGHDVGPSVEMINDIMRQNNINRVYLQPTNDNVKVSIMDENGSILGYVGGEEAAEVIEGCQRHTCPLTMSLNYVSNIVNDVVYVMDGNKNIIDTLNPYDME